jgi:hypothetical protein
MFTYKFVGLDAADAATPYYYGSLPAKPELGHILAYNQTGNRYVVVRIDGKGLADDGDGFNSQKLLALAEIASRETVPTLWLQKIAAQETQPTGRSFSYEEVKGYSQKNREARLSTSA